MQKRMSRAASPRPAACSIALRRLQVHATQQTHALQISSSVCYAFDIKMYFLRCGLNVEGNPHITAQVRAGIIPGMIRSGIAQARFLISLQKCVINPRKLKSVRTLVEKARVRAEKRASKPLKRKSVRAHFNPEIERTSYDRLCADYDGSVQATSVHLPSETEDKLVHVQREITTWYAPKIDRDERVRSSHFPADGTLQTWRPPRSNECDAYLLLRGIAQSTSKGSRIHLVRRICGCLRRQLEKVDMKFCNHARCWKVFCRESDNSYFYAKCKRGGSGPIVCNGLPIKPKRSKSGGPRYVFVDGSTKSANFRMLDSSTKGSPAGMRGFPHTSYKVSRRTDVPQRALARQKSGERTMQPSAPPACSGPTSDVRRVPVEISLQEWNTVKRRATTFRIGFWNVEGVRRSVAKINDTLNTLNYDACFLSETWLTHAEHHKFKHYSMVLNTADKCTSIKDPRRGMGLLVRKGYETLFRNYQCKKSKKHKAWTQWVRVKDSNFDFMAVSVYMPDTKKPAFLKQQKRDDLERELHDLNAMYGHLPWLVGGDMNGHIGCGDGGHWGKFAPKPDPNRDGQKLMRIFEASGLWCHNHRRAGHLNHTYTKGGCQTCPDWVLSKGMPKVPSVIHRVASDISDHFVIGVALPLDFDRAKPCATIPKVRLNMKKLRTVQGSLKYKQLSSMHISNSVRSCTANGSTSATAILKHVEHACKISAHLAAGTVKIRERYSSFGWSDEVADLHTKAHAALDRGDMVKYRKLSKLYDMKRRAKMESDKLESITEWIEAGKSNPNVIWSMADAVNGLAKQPIRCLRHPGTGVVVTSPKDVCEAAAEQCRRTFRPMHHTAGATDDECTSDLHPTITHVVDWDSADDISNTFFDVLRYPFKYVDSAAVTPRAKGVGKCCSSIPVHTRFEFRVQPDDILRARKRLKNGKACGFFDKIPPEFLKHAGPAFDIEVSRAFNLAYHTENDCPEYWRQTVLKLLYKKGDPLNTEKYRMIAVASAMGKLFNAILQRKYLQHCDRYNLLYNGQNGFRPGRSCVQHLITMFEVFEKVREEGDTPHCFFLDLKAAFDRIDREQLYLKLKKWGCEPQLITYLRDMYAKTMVSPKIGEVVSDKKINPELGVSQGDNWSPLAFSVLCNTIFEVIEKSGLCVRIVDKKYNYCGHLDTEQISSCLCYADDCCLICRDRASLAKAVKLMEHLCDDLKLTANVAKCAIMTVSKKAPKCTFANSMSAACCEDDCMYCNPCAKIYWKGEALPEVDSYTYLGVDVCGVLTKTFQLDFSTQVDKILRKINFAYHKLYPVISDMGIPPNVKMQLVNALIRPLRCYGAEAWTPTKKEINKIDAKMNKIYRKVLGCKSTVLVPCLQKLLRTGSTTRDFVYAKKLFMHFSRFSAPAGLHNIMLNSLIKRMKLNDKDIGVKTPIRRHITTWWDEHERFHSKGELKNAMDMADARERMWTFNRKNCPDDVTGTLGPSFFEECKYNHTVAEWMQFPCLDVDKDRSLLHRFNCTELKVLLECIACTSVKSEPDTSAIFGPEIVCKRCGGVGTLEHCTQTCSKLVHKCNLKTILWNEKGAGVQMRNLLRIAKYQRKSCATSALQRGDTVAVFRHRRHSEYKIVGPARTSTHHVALCMYTQSKVNLATKILAELGQLQILRRCNPETPAVVGRAFADAGQTDAPVD